MKLAIPAKSPGLWLFILFFSAAGTLFGGVTGKIAGVVTDSATGEPVPAVNVFIANTDFGASTTLDGYFFILNVPPGVYNLTATHVNYGTLTHEGIEVYADLTATVNFKMVGSAIRRQEVIVKAEKPKIRGDVTATTRLTTGDQLYTMPVVSYVAALANIGGAVGGGANLHIRGGRRGEVAFLVDGMEVKDPLLNTRMLNIGTPAVAEMVAITGGFDAEYGNAQSAIVNVITKDGGKEYHGRIKYSADDLSPHPGARFQPITTTFDKLDTTVTTLWEPPSGYQNYDHWEGSLGGPEPITTYLLPMAGVHIPGFISFFAAGDLTGRDASGTGTWIPTSDWYNHDMMGGIGFEDRRAQTTLNDDIKLTYDIAPTMKLAFGYRTNRQWYSSYTMRDSRHFPYDYTQSDVNKAMQEWTGNDSTYTYIPGYDDDHDGRVDEEILNGKDDDLDGKIDEDVQLPDYNAADHTPMVKINDEQLLVSWNHTLSEKTYYSVKLSRYLASRTIAGGDKPPDQYGSASEPFTDMPGPDGKYNGHYDNGEPFVDQNGDGIWNRNNPANEIHQYHGFAISGDGVEDDVGQPVPAWYEEKSYVWGAKLQLTSQVAKSHEIRTGLDYNYYDIYNKVLPYPTIDNNGTGIYTDIYHVFPGDGALYAQDKMEFKDITLTAGARLDFYMPGEASQHVMAFDSSNAAWNPNYVPFHIPEKIKMFLSPRIGASFAVTDKAYLHAHYGHFYQRPRWADMYESVNQPQTGGTPRVGNPDLDPEKTVSFEVGVAYNPYEDYVVDVTGFMKDVKNWINTRDGKSWYPENFGQPLIGQNFAIYDNQDYAFARGIEFNFSKEAGKNLSGRVTYTLSWVNAKNSYNISTEGIRGNYTEPPIALSAGWDQRHSIVAEVNLTYGPHDPLFGIPGALGDWNFGLIWNSRSGLPYSPTDASGTLIEGQYMTKRTDWTHTADLNVVKYFQIGKFRPSIWIEVYNLFDRQNILAVDDNYGRVGAPNAYDDYTGVPGWVNDATSPNYSQKPFAGPNPSAWDNPRIIRAGLGIDF